MRLILLLTSVMVFLLQASRAFAWDEFRLPDSKLVERSELIVVAHLKPGSIVMHDSGGSYEGHATLVVTEVVKGTAHENEIPIFIAYGLLPVPKSAVQSLDSGPQIASYNYHTNEPVLLFDDNPSEGDFKIIDDLGKDQIWLLWHGTNSHHLGIWNPQDVQPLSKEADLRKCLP